ncbi:MAG: hypothetical protein MJZ60_09805 [Bacteroidaceae bacterium]|nr:hypothetical protein [Bacteroidaceae bacterium]
MDHEFTLKMRAWLESPAELRDLAEGALMLLRLNNNKLMYRNISHNLRANASFIEHNLQKYYNYRVKDMTHEEVKAMDAQVEKIMAGISSFTKEQPADSEKTEETEEGEDADHAVATKPTSEYAKGKRLDHDSLPPEIQACYVENLSKVQRMRELHLKLRSMSTMESPCPDSERYPYLQEIIKLDKERRANWNTYDSYRLAEGGEPAAPVVPASAETTTATILDPAEQSKDALRNINLAKGRYKKSHGEKDKATILNLLPLVLNPTEKLLSELKELGITE